MHKIRVPFHVQEGHGACMKVFSGSLGREMRAVLFCRYLCWRPAMMLLGFSPLVEFNFWFCISWWGTLAAKRMHILVSHTSPSGTWAGESTASYESETLTFSPEHLDIILVFCQYSPICEWEKNDRKQLERCQWAEVHDLWRHFHPSYLVLHALNRLLASSHQWRLLKSSGLECSSPVSLT